MRKSHVYVLPEYVGPWTEVREPERVATYQILDRHYEDLPAEARSEFDVVTAAEVREQADIRAWASAFRFAVKYGDPLPERAFGKTVAVDTSTLMGAENLSVMGSVYLAVILAGASGVTSLEARRQGEVGGGASGALTKLHQAGVVECLAVSR